MADTNSSEPFDGHPESSGYSNDDFEQLDAPGSGFDNGDADGPNAAGSGAYDDYGYDPNQDAEISTTTDNAGEDEPEDDRYAVGASEAEAYAHSSAPRLGDEDDDSFQVQPSAPVPDIDPLIDFEISPDADILPSFASSAPPSSSHYPEPIPTTSNPLREFDFINESEKAESKPVWKSSEESAKGENRTVPVDSQSRPTTTSDKKLSEKHHDLLRQTNLYKWLVGMGSWLKGVDPRESKEEEADTSEQPSSLKALIYWRNVKKTGIVFGTMLVLLLSLAIFSLLSVVAYLSLAVLVVTFSFVVYKKVMGAVQKSNDGHPFKPLLEMDITLREDKLKTVIQTSLREINCTIKELRRLFLVEDIVDSIKFGLLLWALTYIGSWFNGMTLIILALILLFTVPKVYETYQVQIDSYIGLAKAQINNVLNIIQSKLPFLKKKEKAQ